MSWEIRTTNEFDEWFDGLAAEDQARIGHSVTLLTDRGPALARPYADTVNGSRFPNMKELRVQSGGDAIRILFAFDPSRVGVLLVGGAKGDKRFYERLIARADALYAEHLS